MTITIISAVSLAALLGITGLLIIGHKLGAGIRQTRFPRLIVPASLPFILLNVLLAIYFTGMAKDAGAGAVDSTGEAAMYIWAIPASAATLSVLWFLILDVRAITRRK